MPEALDCPRGGAISAGQRLREGEQSRDVRRQLTSMSRKLRGSVKPGDAGCSLTVPIPAVSEMKKQYKQAVQRGPWETAGVIISCVTARPQAQPPITEHLPRELTTGPGWSVFQAGQATMTQGGSRLQVISKLTSSTKETLSKYCLGLFVCLFVCFDLRVNTLYLGPISNFCQASQP